MDSHNAGKVRKGTLLKFHELHELLDEEFENSEYQNLDIMKADYFSEDIGSLVLLEQGIYGFTKNEENALLDLLGKIN